MAAIQGNHLGDRFDQTFHVVVSTKKYVNITRRMNLFHILQHENTWQTGLYQQNTPQISFPVALVGMN